MRCRLELEFCMRSCGCSNCIYNDSPSKPLVMTKGQAKRNEDINARRQQIKEKLHKEFITNILPKTIVPLIGGQEDGCGFFIKGHFVTAGHCLNSGSVAIKLNGKIFKFKRKMQLY